MDTTREIRCKVECRADDSRTSPGRIVGTLIETGRVATDRREVFAPGSHQAGHTTACAYSSRHHGAAGNEIPAPVEDGASLRIDAPLPDTALGRQVAAEIRSGGAQQTYQSSFSPMTKATYPGFVRFAVGPCRCRGPGG